MDVHQNARLTPKGRETMVRAVVDNGASASEVARRFHTTVKTVSKWVRRFQTEGLAGLQDRSSRPHSMPSQTPPATCDTIEALRRGALHTGCDRQRRRPQPINGEPHSQAAWLELAIGP